ncbi:MAG: GGDEF domain-containing protein [Jaaginema sp. PMC 1079.18]|nr:GGDEF domain-containing protein [Jaaginema sp. PMC 1080.18]MEC4852862.1 GGDEF domain-containing protein [Jaaginema sp. PMC 1079.18]MEC4868614.1 GGDEF domain-containing protein [Jaaginema sp. PMC 1078.18]
MKVTVLLVGLPQFIREFTEQYSHLVTTIIEVSAVEEAIAASKQYQPDVVILLGVGAIALEFLSCDYPLSAFTILLDRVEEYLPILEQHKRQLQWVQRGIDLYLPIPAAAMMTAESATMTEELLEAYISKGAQQTQEARRLQQTNDVLSTIALSDQLTELGNRRALDWELVRQIKNARQQKTDFSIIMLDVDRFKSVNDTHGHLVGDRVLQRLAMRLRDRLRVPDSIFRYGGEEFAILLQKTDLAAAVVVAERLREIVEEKPFHISPELILPLTISLGLATLLPNDDKEGQSLINRADANLLKAKAAGRNCTFSD